MKLSQRLQQIDQMITTPYDHIWDCCCDHGYLGTALLKRGAAKTVHFVDVVESLTDAIQTQLESQLNDALIGRGWQVHCEDVSRLTLSDPDSKQLVIIAGVGGDLTMDMVRAITEAHPDHALEFILCPVRQQYQLRSLLIELGYGLIDEVLVEDKQKFYEVIHVSNHSDKPIATAGSQMWDLSRESDREYLERTIAHYTRMEKNAGQQADRILADYRGLLPSV
ncbi:tRNA (adenine(22)-N(1))-methyltransferase TrmK [Pontibacterium sp. N1Y112]|uniref:tRNA (Adenine(22)-N(1))-methyltransferase TrmK n=1 Tax=Pontibacterium sinense TaxID=2781979 RepID=A0A8J7FE78_9GAMM|nr:tRNA (adenine(22)-N(1))-methyltransferase TrmK [Pontibacterium sinense]MBE9399437.1 tRNA (adenine(22)-N(1))-methyltransferase TrmK [Pontibacterium sinense]